jgi:hypothetical protein
MAKILDTDFSSTTFRERDVKKNPVIFIGTQCPVTSRMRKAPKPLSSTPEWVVKTYDTPKTSGVIESSAPTSSDAESNLANKGLLKSRFIKSRRFVMVSDEANLMAKQYGVSAGTVFADNRTDKGIEIHRDIEAVTLKDQESVPAVADSTASVTRGIPTWLSNTTGIFTDTDTAPSSTFRTPTGSIINNKAAASDVSESDIRAALQSVAETRKIDSTSFMGVCRPAMRSQFASFTFTDKNGSTSSNFPLRRWNQTEGEIASTVTRYNSDFGPIDLITSHLIDSTCHMLGLDMEMLEIGYAMAPTYEELPRDGANQWLAIYVPQVLNPQAHFIATSRATA